MNVKRIANILANKDLIINQIVLDESQKKGQIIHGAKAYNYQSPSYLRKTTYDYDILTKSPRKSAKIVAEKLSKRLGEEVNVVKGKHKGTYKVKLDNVTIADYTQLKYKPKTKKYYGVKIKDLQSIKQSTKRIIKNPKAEYRREKDIDTLERIKQIERIDKLFDFN